MAGRVGGRKGGCVRGVGEGEKVGGWKEARTGMVRNPNPCSSSLEAGIFPPSEPSPHWLASRLAFSFRFGPWYRGYSSLGVAGLFPGVFWLFIELSVMVGRCTGLRDKWAEYINTLHRADRLYSVRLGSLQGVYIFSHSYRYFIFACAK